MSQFWKDFFIAIGEIIMKLIGLAVCAGIGFILFYFVMLMPWWMFLSIAGTVIICAYAYEIAHNKADRRAQIDEEIASDKRMIRDLEDKLRELYARLAVETDSQKRISIINRIETIEGVISYKEQHIQRLKIEGSAI